MQLPRIGRAVGVTTAAVALLGTFISANQPAFADSGNKCTSTKNISTCINIRGHSNVVDWITATHHNNNPTGQGKFQLTGPNLNTWSTMQPNGRDVQYLWNEGSRVMLEGTYCVQWFKNGDSRFPELGMGCAKVIK